MGEDKADGIVRTRLHRALKSAQFRSCLEPPGLRRVSQRARHDEAAQLATTVTEEASHVDLGRPLQNTGAKGMDVRRHLQRVVALYQFTFDREDDLSEFVREF